MPRRPSRAAKNPSRARRPARVDAEARGRAFEALNLMRKGRSLRTAAKEAHTTPTTVLRYLPRAVRRGASGRFIATPTDRYERMLYMLTSRGRIAIPVRGSAPASMLGEYWAAVNDYLTTGSQKRLRQFRGKSIRAGKVTYPFITNPTTLRKLGFAGEVSFEDLYAART